MKIKQSQRIKLPEIIISSVLIFVLGLGLLIAYFFLKKEDYALVFIMMGPFLIVLAIVWYISNFYQYKKQQKLIIKINSFTRDFKEMSVSEFFKLYKTPDQKGKRTISYDYKGVYILFNKTKNMYYVGQAERIFKRVNSHFTGKGNGDVYADYKHGDIFTIKMIDIEKTKYESLDMLEKDTIFSYDSYSRGYNKTRGNGLTSIDRGNKLRS